MVSKVLVGATDEAIIRTSRYICDMNTYENSG